MLVVRVSVVPDGGGAERLVGTMRIAEAAGGDDELRDYAVEASKDGRNWKKSRVASFPHREQGVFELVYRALEGLLLERTARRRAGA